MRPCAQMIPWTVLWLAVSWLSGLAQGMDPAQREDLEIERQRILRAADQIDGLVEQQARLVRELEGLKSAQQAVTKELAEGKAENARLSARLEEMAGQQRKEREALLKEVAKLVAESKATATPAPVPKAGGEKTGVRQEEGFEHVVARGETLWAITQAYRQAGNAVTMEEIRAANGLKEGQALRVGQKLFIPKK